MRKTIEMLHTIRHRPLWRSWLLAPVAVVLSGLLWSLSGVGADAPPNIRKANIASVPLYSATQGDKPALALALSVEFPTVGAQYVDQPSATTDASYSPATEYIGYYNAEMCYRYIDNPGETPASGKTKPDYKRFQINGPATARRCGDGFSGNFLNWVSNSAIDMLRMALSGGDRVIDETGLTILQRAVLPNGDPICMWNSSNFPAKQLAKGSDGSFSGAVPQAMVAAANAQNASNIWVANTLNKIYFGTNKDGSCNNPSSYVLNAGIGMGTIADKTSSLPSGATKCADEGGSCTTSGIQRVWYGANNKWKRAPVIGPFSCTNAVFGDPISGTAKACYLESYSGTWTPNNGTPLNTDGFFYARAEVCGRDSGGSLLDDRDYRLCTRYPNGNYKPTGTVQKYSDQLRLAAFGYALEQTLSWDDGSKTNGRYGGVLRAPMKFVGPRTYDSTGVENTPGVGNPNMEWDPITGIFAKNPDNDTTFGVSGVVNYLNQFGRTGPTPGRYKRYDPSGELYYETLRYLQGLPPSPDAVANLDLTNVTQKAFYDGYPIFKDWTNLDPYAGGRNSTSDYACLKSNIALIGDVNTWDSRYTSNKSHNRMATTDLANNVPDIEGWISVVQAFEKATTKTYLDGQGVSRTTSNPNTANSSPNTRGAQVYGLSYWAHTHDIRGADWTAAPDKQRPGLRVKSFFFDVNEYAEQSNDNTRRTNNQYYTAGKYGGFNTQPDKDTSIPYNTQGNPFYDKSGVANNNVWQDPARPLEPQTYFLQSNARGVLAAFEKIFTQAASAQRSIAGAAASGSNLTQGGSHFYQASFDTGNWTGDVQAFNVKVASDNVSIDMASGAAWSAEQELSNRLMAGTPPRNIIVGIRGANPSPTATPFTAAGIDAALKADLNRYSPSAADDGLWQDRLDYLRGNKSKEGAPFRRRYRSLGDVVNSGIQYVGAPSAVQNLGSGYATFVTTNKDRQAALYVGANDGMLHAFDASSGNELFAYIPSWLGPKLSALTDPGYLHQAYVDATPVIGDAQTSTSSTPAWKTVLVSGTGGGGRGVFALDVSDPSTFAADKVMWEFTQANDKDMGYVLGKPRIVKLRTDDGSGGTGTPTDRWFAMVPAGVNNYTQQDASDDNFSRTGAPTIFLLALDKPTGDAWTSTGSSPNYYKISLPFDATLAITNPTGIINLEAYMNGSGVTQYVYAGDLHGRLWALDFTKFDATGWTSGQLSRFSTGSAGSLVAYPMYIAKDAAGKIQPITAAPSILQGADPDQHFVGFGTGKYFENSDATSTQPNTFYVVYDNGSGSASGGTSGTVGIAGRGRLRQVTSDASGALTPASAFNWGRATSDSDATQRSGWYYDLPASGERVVYDSAYVPMTTKVAFSSLIPDSATTPGVCSVAGGTGNSYYVDMLAGTGFKKASTVGVLGQPLIMFNDAGTTETKADSTGRRLRTRPVVLGQQGSQGLNATEAARETFPVGRLSWRQINNYLELYKK